jgi:hypothetical protein
VGAGATTTSRFSICSDQKLRPGSWPGKNVGDVRGADRSEVTGSMEMITCLAEGGGSRPAIERALAEEGVVGFLYGS